MLQAIDVSRADDRIAADADAGRLPEAEASELPDGFVGQRARSADDADCAGLVNVARHDADLALAGGDDAGTVRADQARHSDWPPRPASPGHVEDGNAFGDGDDDFDAARRRLP